MLEKHIVTCHNCGAEYEVRCTSKNWERGKYRKYCCTQCAADHKEIREEISNLYGQNVANRVRIQYGGSVKSSNAKELFSTSDIDGALVGGASLKADEFAKIVNYED